VGGAAGVVVGVATRPRWLSASLSAMCPKQFKQKRLDSGHHCYVTILRTNRVNTTSMLGRLMKITLIIYSAQMTAKIRIGDLFIQ